MNSRLCAPAIIFASWISETADKIIEKSQNSRGDAQSQAVKLLDANNVENSDFAGLFDFSSVPDDIRRKLMKKPMAFS